VHVKTAQCWTTERNRCVKPCIRRAPRVLIKPFGPAESRALSQAPTAAPPTLCWPGPQTFRLFFLRPVNGLRHSADRHTLVNQPSPLAPHPVDQALTLLSPCPPSASSQVQRLPTTYSNSQPASGQPPTRPLRPRYPSRPRRWAFRSTPLDRIRI
jgi:hypothetical protein